MGRIGCRIVLRCDLHHVASNEVDPLQPAQEFEHFAWREPAYLGSACAGCEAWVDAVDVEGEIGRAISDNGTRLLDQCLYPDSRHLFGVDDGHAALVRKLPEILSSSAYADLDGSFGV